MCKIAANHCEFSASPKPNKKKKKRTGFVLEGGVKWGSFSISISDWPLTQPGGEGEGIQGDAREQPDPPTTLLLGSTGNGTQLTSDGRHTQSLTVVNARIPLPRLSSQQVTGGE